MGHAVGVTIKAKQAGEDERKKMKTKTILPIAIAAIFMTLAVAPAISAYKVGVGWNPATEDSTAPKAQWAEVEITEAQREELLVKIEGFWTWLQEAKPLQDWKLSPEEKDVINQFINDLKDILADCPFLGLITFDNVLSAFVSTPLRKDCFVSFGWGKSLMPLNKYEWGFSGGQPFFFPVTFLMKFGYTGVVSYRFPFGAMGYDQVARHIMLVQGLQGLWIDGGSLGYERYDHSGIEFAIGRGRIFTFGNH